MHTLYEDSLKLVEQLKAARLTVARLSDELAKAEYELTLIAAKVEREWIKRVGDDKKLGATVEARERVFTLARDADENYKAQLNRQWDIKAKLDEARIEASALQDTLSVMLAALRAGEATTES